MFQEHPKKFRYMVAYLLEDKKEGEFFDKHILHISVLPWFYVNAPEATIKESFKKEFLGIKALEATLGNAGEFGPNHTVDVSLIESKKLVPLHFRAMEWLAQIHAGWEEDLIYVADKYVPHIRHREGFDYTPGQILDIDSIALLKASEDIHDDRRQVLAKVNFDA